MILVEIFTRGGCILYLSNLIKELKIEKIMGKTNINISNIQYDSRQIKKNNIFICIQGFKTDGHKYIKDVIEKGANAVVIDKELESYSDQITYLKVKNSRKAMATLAKSFFRDPLSTIDLIGVTGTNGKTTTTYLIKEILNKGGYKTGLIGTIEIHDGSQSIPASRTTPESLDIYRYLAKMRDNKVEYVVMEVSSHALALNRVDTMQFKAAVFTNLTQDHLDYHQTMHKYALEKAKLFKKVKSDGASIINNDDNYADFFKEKSSGEIITYGIEKKSTLQAVDIKLSFRGVEFVLDDLNYRLNLRGKFNIYNSLAAISVAKSLDLNERIVKNSLEGIVGIPGRFEAVDLSQDFTVVIDYAHTPDGMMNVLSSVQEFEHESIIVVFGCGGDRDKTKRPLMGELAVREADYVILTNDNPRSEVPATIIDDIKAGIDQGKHRTAIFAIQDRKKAINEAIDLAHSGDVVIIFGKGHETYQVFADHTIDFNDKEVAKAAIRRKLSGV